MTLKKGKHRQQNSCPFDVALLLIFGFLRSLPQSCGRRGSNAGASPPATFSCMSALVPNRTFLRAENEHLLLPIALYDPYSPQDSTTAGFREVPLQGRGGGADGCPSRPRARRGSELGAGLRGRPSVHGRCRFGAGGRCTREWTIRAVPVSPFFFGAETDAAP